MECKKCDPEYPPRKAIEFLLHAYDVGCLCVFLRPIAPRRPFSIPDLSSIALYTSNKWVPQKKKQTPKNLGIYHVKNLLDREIHTTVVIQFSRFRFAHVRRGKEVIRPTNCRHRPRWESVGALNRVEFPEMPLARICFVFKARQGNENFSKPKGKKKQGRERRGEGRESSHVRRFPFHPTEAAAMGDSSDSVSVDIEKISLGGKVWSFEISRFFVMSFGVFYAWIGVFFFFFEVFQLFLGGLVWVFIFGILWLILGNVDALERIFALFDFLFELSWWLRLWESNWGFFSPVSFEVCFLLLIYFGFCFDFGVLRDLERIFMIFYFTFSAS